MSIGDLDLKEDDLMTQYSYRCGRGRIIGFWPIAGSILSVLLSGCLAQQAELNQVKGDLSSRIAKLDQRDKELQQTVKQAKLDIDKLISETRARLSQEITAMRDEDLPSLRGGLDKSSHQVTMLRNRLDDIEHQSTRRLSSIEKSQNDLAAAYKADRDRLQDEFTKFNARLDTISATMSAAVKTLSGRLEEQDKAGSAVEVKIQQLESQNRQLESQNRALTEQMAQYGKALSDFKKVLTGLGDKLVQEEQRTNELSTKLLGRADALTAKVETDAKATTAHLNDVNKSVGSVAKALETMSGQIISRVEEQDHRLDEMARALQSVHGQVNALVQTVAQLRPAQESPIKGAEDASQRSMQPGSITAPAEPASSPASTRYNSASSETPPVQPQDTGAREVQVREIYDRYLQKFRQGDLDGALLGFSQFLTQYPTSELASNAQYWLGG
ncbi:MAG: hypothetical protein C4293_05885, partial [Nitrospiraceae bacterium]